MRSFVVRYKDVEFSGLYDPENGDMLFHHPLTGQLCEWVDQIFQGWSEQDSERSLQWDYLIENFENDLENGLIGYWLDEAVENEIAIFDYENGFVYNKEGSLHRLSSLEKN